MSARMLLVKSLLALAVMVPTCQPLKAAPAPRYLAFTIGPVDARRLTFEPPNPKTAFIVDKSSGYCLYVEHSSADQLQMLLISRRAKLGYSDFDSLPTSANDKRVQRLKIQPLGNERVRIGDTPQKVLGILGLPPQHDGSIDGEPEITGAGTFLYDYSGGHLNGWSYEAWYSFQHGRLASISITMQKGSEVAG